MYKDNRYYLDKMKENVDLGIVYDTLTQDVDEIKQFIEHAIYTAD